jgi:hypothetical protein
MSVQFTFSYGVAEVSDIELFVHDFAFETKRERELIRKFGVVPIGQQIWKVFTGIYGGYG